MFCFVFFYFVFAGGGTWSMDSMRAGTSKCMPILKLSRVTPDQPQVSRPRARSLTWGHPNVTTTPSRHG